MPDFFKLTTQQTEDKVISREQRIYADAMTIPQTNSFTVQTTSNAPRLKIKFFLDAVELSPLIPSIPDPRKAYTVGQYYELEHLETVQIINTIGIFTFRYECTANDGSGVFTCKFVITPIVDKTIQLFISSIVFEDSFYNSANRNNISTILRDQTIPYVRTAYTTDASLDTSSSGAMANVFDIMKNNGEKVGYMTIGGKYTTGTNPINFSMSYNGPDGISGFVARYLPSDFQMGNIMTNKRVLTTASFVPGYVFENINFSVMDGTSFHHWYYIINICKQTAPTTVEYNLLYKLDVMYANLQRWFCRWEKYVFDRSEYATF